jgi:hypothetical protein
MPSEGSVPASTSQEQPKPLEPLLTKPRIYGEAAGCEYDHCFYLSRYSTDGWYLEIRLLAYYIADFRLGYILCENRFCCCYRLSTTDQPNFYTQEQWNAHETPACPYCAQSFKIKTAARERHLAYHSNEKWKPSYCPRCALGFRTKQIGKFHIEHLCGFGEQPMPSLEQDSCIPSGQIGAGVDLTGGWQDPRSGVSQSPANEQDYNRVEDASRQPTSASELDALTIAPSLLETKDTSMNNVAGTLENLL